MIDCSRADLAADGWIKHDGGPRPVDADAVVDVIICSGDGFQSGMAGSFGWKISPALNGAITHYRLHRPDPDYKALLEQAVEALRSVLIEEPNRLASDGPCCHEEKPSGQWVYTGCDCGKYEDTAWASWAGVWALEMNAFAKQSPARAALAAIEKAVK